LIVQYNGTYQKFSSEGIDLSNYWDIFVWIVKMRRCTPLQAPGYTDKNKPINMEKGIFIS
jgi:hypothetical protein